MPRCRVVGKRRVGRAVVWSAVLSAAALLALPAIGRSESVKLDSSLRPRIVNGLPTRAYPSVGALLYSQGGPITATNATPWCSGTLIGCETFLVASHCVSDAVPSHFWVYLQHAGVFAVTSVTRHPDYTSAGFPLSDVAVLKLNGWVTGIDPAALTQTDPAPLIPLTGTIVGFGQSSGVANDYGLKRYGAVQTASCPLGLPNGITDAEAVCWTFSGPLGPAGSNSNTCNGDSGGPLFVDVGAGPVVAGVTSGGTSFDCLPTDFSYDANVFAYKPFIDARLGSDATDACGGLPPVGDVQNTQLAQNGHLDTLNPSDSFSVSVPTGANSLRVTLNGEDDGVFDPNLYVKLGLGAAAGNFDCKADGRMTFGACVIDHPAAGLWSMAVERAQGAGGYQLTATVFGGAPTQCGNGVREFDEGCDGADDAQCDGLCQLDCSCPAPSCGNDVQEQSEACDGSAASGCPDECGSDCTCPLPCSIGDLYDARLRLDAKHLKYRARLLNFDNQFTGADPRNGLRFTITQGTASVSLTIPAGDAGWSSSRPDKGRYLWRGERNGFTRIKAIDRSAQSGTWKLIVVGKDVPGGGDFELDLPLEVHLSMDGQCTDDTF